MTDSTEQPENSEADTPQDEAERQRFHELFDRLPEPIRQALEAAVAGMGQPLIIAGFAQGELRADLANHDPNAADDYLIDFLDTLDDTQLAAFHGVLHTVQDDDMAWARIDSYTKMVQRERRRGRRAQSIAALHQFDPRIDPDKPRGNLDDPPRSSGGHTMPQTQDSGGVRTPNKGEDGLPLEDAPGSGGAAIGSPDDEDSASDS